MRPRYATGAVNRHVARCFWIAVNRLFGWGASTMIVADRNRKGNTRSAPKPNVESQRWLPMYRSADGSVQEMASHDIRACYYVPVKVYRRFGLSGGTRGERQQCDVLQRGVASSKFGCVRRHARLEIAVSERNTHAQVNRKERRQPPGLPSDGDRRARNGWRLWWLSLKVSPARSMGIVVAAMPPALMTANQAATQHRTVRST